MQALFSLGVAWATQNHLLPTPASGGTFQQNGQAFALARVPIGTYKLPDNGLPMYVQATGSVTITSVAGVVVAAISSGSVKLFMPTSSTTWTSIAGATYGYIDFPLNSFRETSGGNVGNAAANGGVLASDTTPILAGKGGGSNRSQRLSWAASNVDEISSIASVPGDFDGTQDCYVELIGLGDADDWDATSVITNWNDGVNITDATDSPAGGTAATVCTATVAAADVPDAPYTVSLTIIPPTHGTDSLVLLGARIRYRRL